MLGWQGRASTEGSRSNIVILRITQRAYPASIDIITQDLLSVYYSTFLPLSLYLVSVVRKRPCKSSNSDRSLEVRSSKPPRSNSESNSPPSKKVQQNLTFAQTHQAPHQLHQRPFKISRRPQQHTRPALDPSDSRTGSSHTIHAPFGQQSPTRGICPLLRIQYIQCIADGQDKSCALAEDGRPLLASQRAL